MKTPHPRQSAARTGPGTSAMPQARCNIEGAQNSCAESAQAVRQFRPPGWIAKGDLQDQEQQRSTHRRTSSFLLSLQLAQRLLGFFNVSKRELARFDKMRHDGLRSATKEGQQIVNELALGMVARNGGGEDMKI